MAAVQLLKPQILACTPSYALHLAEWAARARHRPAAAAASSASSSPASRAAASRRCARSSKRRGAPRSPRRWASATSRVSLWGECEQQHGMHFAGRGFVHFELIDPDTGDADPDDGRRRRASWSRRISRHRGAPLLRFRSRDHVVIWTGALRLRPHRAARALHRPHRRHADRARRQRVPVRASARSSTGSRRRSAA